MDTDRFDPVPDGAAKFGGVTLQIIPDYWVLEFNALGEGLIDRKPPGQAPRLDGAHRAALAAIIERSDPSHSWRRAMADRNVGRRRVDHQQQAIGVYGDMALAFDDLLGGVMASRFRFGRFDQLTVDDASLWACFTPRLLHGRRIQHFTPCPPAAIIVDPK